MTRWTYVAPGAILLGVALAGCVGDQPIVEPDPPGPSPFGQSLTGQPLQELLGLFDDNPYTGGQVAPNHRFFWIDTGTVLAINTDGADTTQATRFQYMALGVQSHFCAEDQPQGADGGFSHFHKWASPDYSQGEGRIPAEPGYWFLHVSAHHATGPGGPGVDYNFKATPAMDCTTLVPRADFDPQGDGPLDAAEIEALTNAFHDQPFDGGQRAPGYVFRWTTEDVFVFLVLNDPVPEDATQIDHFGVGVRGRFCANDQPTPDFTQFRQWNATAWDASHGGQAGDWGYWLLHAATRPLQMPWGSVGVGTDRAHDPTPPPNC